MSCVYSVSVWWYVWRVPRMCVFSLVCECECVYVFFYGGLVQAGHLKGARQLPFTAPGGNKQWGRGSYLPLLLGQEAKRGTLLRSHCNYTQLQGKKRNKEEIVCKIKQQKRAVLASLNSSLRNPSLSSFYLLYDCVCLCVCVCVCVWTRSHPSFFPAPFSFSGPLTAHSLLSTSAVNQLYPVIQLAFPDTPTDPHYLTIWWLVR